MCDRPEASLSKLFAHLDLPDESGELTQRWAPTLSRPEYYRPSFSETDERAIAEETNEVAMKLGYGLQD